MFLHLDAAVLTFLAGAFCVVMIGIAKAGFAGGVGVLATPFFSLVVPPSRAAAILLPLLCGCDLVAIYYYRRTFSARRIRQLVPGAVLGIIAGTALLAYGVRDSRNAEQGLKLMIGSIALVFVLYQAGRSWISKRTEKYHPKGWHGWIFGGVAGMTSTLAHAGGPPIAIYLLPQHLDRRVFVGTTVWFFAIINYLKLIPYYSLGLFRVENLRLSLMLMPLVPVGVWCGVWMNRRIDQEIFTKIVYVILFFTGLQLVFGWNPISALAHVSGI